MLFLSQCVFISSHDFLFPYYELRQNLTLISPLACVSIYMNIVLVVIF